MSDTLSVWRWSLRLKFNVSGVVQKTANTKKAASTHLGFTFLQSDCGSDVIIGDHNKVVTFPEENRGVFGSVAVPTSAASLWVIEVHWIQEKPMGGNIYIGIGDKTVVDLETYCGAGKSISYRPQYGDVWRNGNPRNVESKHTHLKKGDLLGVKCHPKMPNHLSLEYYINEKYTRNT
eukprot:TRINITY_DN360_c0_g1_i2.p1 TRINITY_DN360_c0_g1~~TRINITY_DN360_c0_g1_i2.p1  ORF type:complete len:177 (+),score=23.22 TRINITY_DN360_c0_g1_i2:96-626(+)